MNLTSILKAVIGGLVSGLTSAGTALLDGTISPSEWVAIALSFIIGTGVVYAVPNSPKVPTPNRTETP